MSLSSRDLKTPEDVVTWTEYLDQNWPARKQVVHHIAAQVKTLPFLELRILELAPGAGVLAEGLLTSIPGLTYVGVDLRSLMLTAAWERLKPFSDQVTLIQADLNEDAWLDWVTGPFHAVVTMQSLHDLGGEAEVDRVYALAKALLVPGGMFLNADLVVSPDEELPDNPGRRSIPRHLELLQAHGYERTTCLFELADFGCCIAYKPDAD